MRLELWIDSPPENSLSTEKSALGIVVEHRRDNFNAKEVSFGIFQGSVWGGGGILQKWFVLILISDVGGAFGLKG